MMRFTSLVKRHWLTIVYVLSAVVVTIQRGVFGFANDYAIFRASFWNLVSGRDLYALHLDQARDIFKYSPTFAVLFAPLSLLPFTLGLLVWNMLGAVVLVYAVKQLILPRDARVVLAVVYLTMLRNMQSAQSNTLIAALIVLAFVALERNHQWRAALFIALGAVIKIFPLAALSLAAARRVRLRFALQFAVVLLALVALPLIVTSPHTLATQYRSWRVLESAETHDYGMSAMGIVHTWLGFAWPSWAVQLAGTGLLLLPVLRAWRGWETMSEVRLRFLASLLVYCVIFNHKAEASSYVIALTGVAIWYVASPPSLWHTALLGIVLALTSVTGSDVTPELVKASLGPLARTAFPCTAAWLVMQFELLTLAGPAAIASVPEQSHRFARERNAPEPRVSVSAQREG